MKNIYCIDRDPFLCKVYETLFKKMLGQEFFYYGDVGEGLLHLSGLNPDLVILDVETLGIERATVVEIVSKLKNVKLIFTSRFFSSAELTDFDQLEISMGIRPLFWRKPIKVQELLEKAEELLEMPKDFWLESSDLRQA